MLSDAEGEEKQDLFISQKIYQNNLPGLLEAPRLLSFSPELQDFASYVLGSLEKNRRVPMDLLPHSTFPLLMIESIMAMDPSEKKKPQESHQKKEVKAAARFKKNEYPIVFDKTPNLSIYQLDSQFRGSFKPLETIMRQTESLYHLYHKNVEEERYNLVKEYKCLALIRPSRHYLMFRMNGGICLHPVGSRVHLKARRAIGGDQMASLLNINNIGKNNEARS